jgi:hypothetical protein
LLWVELDGQRGNHDGRRCNVQCDVRKLGDALLIEHLELREGDPYSHHDHHDEYLLDEYSYHNSYPSTP